jgi:hypothetical protein
VEITQVIDFKHEKLFFANVNKAKRPKLEGFGLKVVIFKIYY